MKKFERKSFIKNIELVSLSLNAGSSRDFNSEHFSRKLFTSNVHLNVHIITHKQL